MVIVMACSQNTKGAAAVCLADFAASWLGSALVGVGIVKTAAK